MLFHFAESHKKKKKKTPIEEEGKSWENLYIAYNF